MAEWQIKVSIIVPVYNVENYLQRCLESLLNQTEKNIEIICVEDCSTDGSYELLKRIGRTDERIQIVNNSKNRGLAFSRNRGITMAKGEFLMFVDSDDYIPDCTVDEMYRTAKERKLDLVYGDVKMVSESGESEDLEQVRIRKGTYADANGIQMFMQLVDQREMFGAAWGVLYRTSFIKGKGLMFRNGVLHEDIPFTFKTILLCERTGCIKEICYYYVQRAESIMSGSNTEPRITGLITAYFEMLMFWNENADMLEEISESISSFLHIYYRFIQYMYGQVNSLQLESHMLAYLEDIGMFKNAEPRIRISTQDMQTVKSSDKVLIYGAGRMAIKVYNFLNARNIHIDAFIVTDITYNPKIIQNIPVYGKNFLGSVDEKTVVILGVSSRFKDEIIGQLDRERSYKIIEYIE